MVRKKIDNRIRILIDNCVATKYRSFFVVVGEKARDQIVILHHMLSKAEVRARPNVLWAYKKELGFSTHRKKRMRQLKKKMQSGKMALNEDDPFEHFIASTNIRYCYYHETYKILGQTFGMAIIQDFETLTPTLLARIVETVEGGGMIIILLQSFTNIKQLLTMSEDTLTRYRPETADGSVQRFNERLMLSLQTCNNCLVIDDQLRILPISENFLKIKPLPPKSLNESKSPEEEELNNLQLSFRDTQPIGVLVDQCRTFDQAKAVLKFVDVLAEKNLRAVIALTSARGRGKSAAMGLAVAGAVALGYANIYVTSPHPENLNTFFVFLIKGFEALGYEGPRDYEVTQSDITDHNKAVIRVKITREHRQSVQYIQPSDASKLGQAELLVIDEAAAIPLPTVKRLLGPYVVFLSSTISGYEGTGRALSLKLLSQLRQNSIPFTKSKADCPVSKEIKDQMFCEITLNESIRYRNGDAVEAWLNKLLCFKSSLPRLPSCLPAPEECELYYVNRDSLFSCHESAEAFLERIVGIFFSSIHQNSPNDLLLMSDAPVHHLFCLLPPITSKRKKLPEILCVILVSLDSNACSYKSNKRYGTNIAYTVSEQFLDEDFKSLTGLQIVRIAAHPECQGKGYGYRALQLLQKYFEEKIPTTNEIPLNTLRILTEEDSEEYHILEKHRPDKCLPPLLLKLNERPPEKPDYISVSYGLNADLLNFWKKNVFVPVYLHETPDSLTGEHLCIMLKTFDSSMMESANWLYEYWIRFCRTFVSKLNREFRTFECSLVLNILKNDVYKTPIKELTVKELEKFFLFEMNCSSLLCTDAMEMAKSGSEMYFNKYLNISLTLEQEMILLIMGLQDKTADKAAQQLNMSRKQILVLFYQILVNIYSFISDIVEKAVTESTVNAKCVKMKLAKETFEEELRKATKEIEAKQKLEAKRLRKMDFSEHCI